MHSVLILRGDKMRGYRTKAYVFDDFSDMPNEDVAITAFNVLSEEALAFEKAVQAFTNAWVKNKESILFKRGDQRSLTTASDMIASLLSAEEVMQILKTTDENEYVTPRAYPEIDGDEFLKFISNESTHKK